MPRTKKITGQAPVAKSINKVGKKAPAKTSALPKKIIQKEDVSPAPVTVKKIPAKKNIDKKSVEKKTVPISSPQQPITTETEKSWVENELSEKKAAITSTQSFVYGGAAVLFGLVALVVFVGFILLPPLIKEISQSSGVTAAGGQTQDDTVATQTLPSSATVPAQQFAFYGMLLSNDNGVMTVKEIQSPLPLDNQANAKPLKTYLVQTNAQTQYTYQRPRDEQNKTAPLFAPEAGTLQNIKKDMFVQVTTPDDTEKNDTVLATQIIYSEKSPFPAQ